MSHRTATAYRRRNSFPAPLPISRILTMLPLERVQSLCFRVSTRAAVLALVAFGVAACGRGGPATGAAPGAAMAMPVEVTTLTPKPVDQVTEFVATIKSRHSTTIQPQVEGYITKIDVKSGDRVSPGTVLFEIDAASQQ